MGRPKTASKAEIERALAPGFRAVPYWWDELGVTPPSQGDLIDDVDFLIVGAGFSGLSAGRTLAANGAKVLIVDAERPFYGASSRNMGFFGQAFEGGGQLSTPEGRARFDEYLESTAYLRQIMAEDSIDAAVRSGRYNSAFHPSHFDEMKAGVKATHDAYPKFRYEIVEPGEGKRFFNSPTASHGGIYLPDALYLQPARLAHGNYLGAVAKGAHVVGQTRVEDIEREASNRYIVTTNRGKVTAKKVLIAVGGYGAPGFGALSNVLPVSSWVISTPPLTPDQMASVWERPMSMKNSKTNFNIIVPTPDGKRLLINGRTGVRYASLEAMAVDLCRVGEEILPQLGPIRATHAWQGIFGMTWDFQKHIFEDDEGVTYLTGDNGSGIGKLHWLGHKTALRMMGQAEGKTVFAASGPPPTFYGYVGRSDWFVPPAVAYYDFKDGSG
ncbi:NAD(P)/FAD-dependent oxidoreductase [Sphingopyxis sp. YR583]|uniref:NAD(P)/FAD-dependent oxidoreductase n=1 Tax=Sphingopyxis sp. YR583 TaxID=1881047 RepID=UPI0015A53B3A|nr:FAD-dependent oxidoreductase [Sphingopyxis sp. YR583]